MNRVSHKAVCILSVMCCLLLGIELRAQTQTLKGIVLNENNRAIVYADILVLPSGSRTITNTYGAFMIRFNTGDTLCVHATGYAEEKLLTDATDTLLRIVLKRPAIMVKRKPLSDSLAIYYADFMKHDSLLNYYGTLKSFKPKVTLDVASTGLVATGLLSALLYEITPRCREAEKTLQLVEIYQKQVRADERLNENYIMKTLACNKAKAVEVLRKCRLTADFILSANDYDLMKAVKECATK